MELTVTGQCVHCEARTVSFLNKKTGKTESFQANNASLIGKGKPFQIELGERLLEKGKCYQLPVYIRLYKRKDGEPAYQVNVAKDAEVVELKSIDSSSHAKLS